MDWTTAIAWILGGAVGGAAGAMFDLMLLRRLRRRIRGATLTNFRWRFDSEGKVYLDVRTKFSGLANDWVSVLVIYSDGDVFALGDGCMGKLSDLGKFRELFMSSKAAVQPIIDREAANEARAGDVLGFRTQTGTCVPAHEDLSP